jgi:hypothetical protein
MLSADTAPTATPSERPRLLAQSVLLGAAFLACVLTLAMSDQSAASPSRLLGHDLERLPLVAQGVVSRLDARGAQDPLPIDPFLEQGMP